MRAPFDREALIVAMTLVPGLVSRNRCFALFQNLEVRRARARAAQLRGMVRQLSGAQGHATELSIVHSGGAWEIRYRVPGVRMERRSLLNALEYACVAYLGGRAGIAGLSAGDDDRGRIDAALRRLAAGIRLVEIEAGHSPNA